jgi:prevent-host-death family protein
MVTTLRRAKAELSEMVRRAQAGEEVIITVRRQPAVRLQACSGASSGAARTTWLRELASLRRQTSGDRAAASTDAILAEDREGDGHP